MGVSTNQARELLSGVPLFAGLTKKQQTELAKTTKPMSFPAGATVVTQGEMGGRFFVITSGTAKAVVNGRTRRRIGAGEFFGEIALIDEGPRSATIVAETDLEVLTLASFNFKAQMKTDASLAYAISLALCKMLRTALD